MRDKVGEVRNSQLISTFGPGSIMDLPDFSVIIASLDHWNLKHCSQINEPRLQKKLKISKIYSPPALGDDRNNIGTLPAFRFPKYMVCPECRKLAPFRNFYIDEKTQIAYCNDAKCDGKETKVFPARFIVACAKGHIEDFPWSFYVHSKSAKADCKGKLLLNDNGATGSISDVEVECTECGEKRTLEDAFSGSGIPSCRGHRQWMGNWSIEGCDEKPRALLRGASNLYFPIVASALSIPPYTNPIHQAIAEEEERLAELDTKDKLKLIINLGVIPTFRDFDLDDLWDAILHQRGLVNGSEQDLLYPEWEAIHAGGDANSEFDFETEEQEVPDRYSDKISRLIMIKRLTEIRVLDGFSRIEPLPDMTSIGQADEEVKESFKASLSERKLSWRPGLVTRGEGVFISLSEERINKWERSVESAAIPMKQEFIKYCQDRKIPGEHEKLFPGTRYVLLHTLAHALMRQLCLGSGYSSSSLRERIYSRSISGQQMAGILIYTATPDSEGSLGGLVELGRTDKFEEVLFHALEDARFCSGDPLCSEHKPDAIGELNGAACHACQLVAETSCENSNLFLDRAFLIPTISEQDLAYFD